MLARPRPQAARTRPAAVCVLAILVENTMFVRAGSSASACDYVKLYGRRIAEPRAHDAGQKADFAAPKICLLADKERKTCEEPAELSKMTQ